MLEQLKWWIARKELVELERWRVQWNEHRRWFAEFPSARAALDNMKAEVEGKPVEGIYAIRDSLRVNYAKQCTNREVFKNLLASLAAAVSLLKAGGRKAAPCDTMFKIMLNDYEKAIEQGRAGFHTAEELNK